MNAASCLTSVSCLESWQRGLTLAGIFLAALVGLALLYITNRISDLQAPRTFTPEQERGISDGLRNKLPLNFRIMTYGPSGDGAEYGSKLEKLLADAGWRSQGTVVFHVGGGEDPPTGITVMVDGLHQETTSTGKNLAEALKAAKVEDVKFVIDKNLPDPLASTWALIKVGRRDNR